MTKLEFCESFIYLKGPSDFLGRAAALNRTLSVPVPAAGRILASRQVEKTTLMVNIILHTAVCRPREPYYLRLGGIPSSLHPLARACRGQGLLPHSRPVPSPSSPGPPPHTRWSLPTTRARARPRIVLMSTPERSRWVAVV